MKDVNGKEIHVGDHVVFATWGMFDIHESHWRNTDRSKAGYYIERRDGDPKYVTHLDKGTVTELLHEEDASLLVTPEGYSGPIHFCMKPGWNARPEYLEVVDKGNG